MKNCDKACKPKCWSDYVEDKYSIFGKIVFIYVITLLTLSNFLLKEYNSELRLYFQN